jgi:hypothetical protein
MAFPKYQTKELLNKVLNSGEDALNVDLSDSVTVTVDSEFPAAAALADNSSNPTTTSVGSHLLGYDSGNTNWNRVEVDDAGHLQIDVLSITAGDNNIGNVDIASIAAGDNNIGNVDIASALPAGSNTIGVVDLGSTDNAVLDAIAASLALLDNSIQSGNELQVDIVGSLPAGSAAIGKLAANSGVDIGDVDVTSVVPGTGATNLGKAEDAAHSSGDTGVMALAVRNDDVAALAGADGDYSPLQVNAAGSLYTKDETGEAGSILVTGTTAVTSPSNTKFIAIQFIEDSVFDSGNDGLISATNQLYPSTQYTGTDIDADGGAVADSVSFPQGMTIFGRWSGFKLASGKVIGYIGYV